MWRRPKPSLAVAAAALGFRRRHLYTAMRHGVADEGDWSYSSEWWGKDSDIESHSVFRGVSEKGNGVVSVLSYPCSRPSPNRWKSTEEQQRQRYERWEYGYNYEFEEKFSILGYQWRVLRFNDDTRQSTVKVMATSLRSKPGSVFLKQQGECLAVPYTKSMASAGLASLACCGVDICSRQYLRMLCIGHGGGSLPLFLASTIEGADIDVVEIDPLVISASVEAMGFPPNTVTSPSVKRVRSHDTIQDALWGCIHNKLNLYESDAEQFVLDNKQIYDIVFIDAYDGYDVFPHKLWDPDSPFLEALAWRLHPGHGTVVVNLHSDVDIRNSDGSVSSFVQSTLPMGKYISKVCSAYKDAVLGYRSCTRKGSPGVGFVVSVRSLCNTTLVVSRGFPMNRGSLDSDSVLNTLISKSIEMEDYLDLPFSCLKFIKSGFVVLD